MATTNDKAARTIEDIERRAAEITEAEFDAVRTLALCYRELAVALPEGSTLVYELAKAAKFVDQYLSSAGQGDVVHKNIAVSLPLLDIIRGHRQALGGGEL